MIMWAILNSDMEVIAMILHREEAEEIRDRYYPGCEMRRWVVLRGQEMPDSDEEI